MMQRWRHRLILGLVALAALIAGLFAASPQTSPAATLLAHPLVRLEGAPARLSDWQGKVMVVNLWATWCPPCVKEVPELIRLHTDLSGQGVVVIGVAVDDAPAVARFARDYGINYPVVLADASLLEATAALGNTAGVLPYTVLLDREGEVITTLTGDVTAEILKERLAGHL